jgi:acyl-CoA thioesterase-1
LRAARLAYTVGSYKSYWQDRTKTVPQTEDFIYVALGDSAAQGIGASRPEKGYVGLIADHITKRTGRQVIIYNLSVSGAKTADVIEKQLPQLSSLPQPHLVTIEIGANDVPVFDQETFTSTYRQLMGLLPDNTVVANVPSFRNGRLSKFSDEAARASAIADTLIATHPRLVRADLHTATNNLGIRDFAADFFHPSDSAYLKWATSFIHPIEETGLLDTKLR